MESENDSIHANYKERQELYTPEQWFTVVRATAVSIKPYRVKEMA